MYENSNLLALQFGGSLVPRPFVGWNGLNTRILGRPNETTVQLSYLCVPCGRGGWVRCLFLLAAGKRQNCRQSGAALREGGKEKSTLGLTTHFRIPKMQLF